MLQSLFAYNAHSNNDFLKLCFTCSLKTYIKYTILELRKSKKQLKIVNMHSQENFCVSFNILRSFYEDATVPFSATVHTLGITGLKYLLVFCHISFKIKIVFNELCLFLSHTTYSQNHLLLKAKKTGLF